MATTETAQKLTDSITEAIANLAAATDAVYQDETFRAWLRTMATFHKYSWHNQLAIWSQKPTATHVAGFNTWKQLGRSVRKGEKAIHILAPLVGKPKSDEQNPDQPSRPRVYGFRGACVFDISQTDGAELPTITHRETEGAEHVLPILHNVAAHLGITVQTREITENPHANGFSAGGLIVVSSRLTASEQAGTLAHEIAHELIHQGDNRKEANEKGKQQRELEAEATAYVVLQHFGVTMPSQFYLAAYSITAEMLSETMATISKTAGQIIALCSTATGTTEGRTEPEPELVAA